MSKLKVQMSNQFQNPKFKVQICHPERSPSASEDGVEGSQGLSTRFLDKLGMTRVFSHLTFICHLGFVIWILFLLFSSTPVLAGSTALSNSKFTVQGDPGTVVSEVLTVSNLSDQAQVYRFYPDEAGQAARQRISLSPSEFQLQPRQSLDVMVRFRQEKENWRTHLNLVAYGESQERSSFRVADGIKIPVNFIVPQVAGALAAPGQSNSWLWFWNAFIFGIDFILLSIVCYWCYQRYFWQRIHLNHKINFL